jgi:glycosyltransferase involved in cell wall biosynthesis
MEMKIAVLHFADIELGGIPTYIRHFIKGMEEFGNSATYLYFGARPKKMYQNIGFRSLNIKFIRKQLESYDIIFVPSGFVNKEKEKYINLFFSLKVKKVIVFHDPPEFEKSPFKNHLKSFDSVILIRPTNKKWFEEKYPNVKSALFLHAYGRRCDVIKEKENLAVDTARIDWDKHQDIIIRNINKIRGEVRIYGIINPQYEYHKLRELNWKKYWYGKFSDAIPILQKAKVMVDMSAIKQDGGGTQYTFLEAMDAQAVPVISEKWGEGALKDGVNCLLANEENLADKINSIFEDDELRNRIVQNNLKILESRSYKNRMPELIEYLENIIK